jgi:hypothetical protein
MDDPGLDLVGAELLEGARNGFDRALHVALDQERKLLLPLSCSWLIICSREPRRLARPPSRGQALAVLGDLAGAGLILDHGEAGRRPRRAELKPRISTGKDGSGFLDVARPVVDQRAHTAPLQSPATTMSPGLSVPAEPARWQPDRGPSSLASITTPSAVRSGLALRSRSSACSRIASSSLSRLSA